MTFCIGISAIFESSRTVHARTFLAAVNHFVNTHNTQGLSFIFEDDDACYEGGRRAAQRLIAKGADIVVGHFSSDAAVGALPEYQRFGIPVLLPAATKQQLVGGMANVFRLCPCDNGLMALLAKHLLQSYPGARVQIAHDSTEHGEALSQVLISILANSSVSICSSVKQAAAVVYCGRLNNSIRYVNALFNQRCHVPIYLTDDALSSWLIQNIPQSDSLRIVGFATGNHMQAGYETYYLESIAALQIAKALSYGSEIIEALNTVTFNTVTGDVQFSDGENRMARAALWKIHNQHFIPSTSA